MSSLQALQLLTTAARLARDERESFSKVEINKKLQDIKYLSSQKKVPRLSLRKDIIHLENQLQGVLELEERFARHKDKESVTVASLKQQITVLKNKLRAVEDLDLDKKVDHLSFLLGEHLAKREIAGEVALSEAVAPASVLPSEEKAQTPEVAEEKVKEQEEEKTEGEIREDKHQASLDTGKKTAMLQKRLEALKQELEIHRALETKKPQEMKLIEEKIALFEEKLEQYYELHPEAMLHEVGTVDLPADFEV
ncbi:MAG: hypothetical protein AABX31_03085 [Nanoarchaeota archaeon]